MPESIELPEAHHAHENDPLVVPVSVTISILAVLVAIVTLMGHRAHTEELSRETQAASRWEQYQAKSIRQRMTQVGSDLISVVAPLNKEKGEWLAQKYVETSLRSPRHRVGPSDPPWARARSSSKLIDE